MQNKNYLPVDLKINQFSAFPNTSIGLILSNDILYTINLETGNRQEIKLEDLEEISKISVISETRCIVATYYDVFVLQLNANQTFTIEQKYEADFGSIRTLAASEDASIIVATGYDDIKVIANGKIKAYNFQCWSMTITKNGQWIALGNAEKITIFDIHQEKIVYEFIPKDLVISLAFSPDQKTLLLGDDRKNLWTIDIATGQIFTYENPFFSKPVNLFWLDSTRFIIVFLSKVVGIYQLQKESTTQLIQLNDFSSRYFQYAALLTQNTLAIAVENLRNQRAAIEGVPKSDVLVMLDIKE